MNAFVIVNPAPAPDQSSPALMKEWDDYLSMIDIFIPNETELRMLCGDVNSNNNNTEENDIHLRPTEEEMAVSLLNRGIRQAVIVTLGARGAMVVERVHDTTTTTTTTTYVDAVSIPDLPCRTEPIVDTVGAGDAFCGALAAYLSTAISSSSSSSSTTVANEKAIELPKLSILACGYATMSTRRRGTNYPMTNEIPPCLRISAMVHPTLSKRRPLTFVTGNAKKLEEVRQILGATTTTNLFPYEITNQSIDLPELQGDVHEIAQEKCRLAAMAIGGPCFIEDTSLCFNALNGMPGPYIKWFLQQCGHDGLNRMLTGFDDTTAYAQTIVAYTNGHPTDVIHIFDGRTNGTIVPPRGSLDFGWDPIFEPLEGGGLTYAEMNKHDKNLISHRGRAFSKFQAFLMEQAKDK
jgi:inosine triphosphate pyrophosphatase